jgi:hypothetical protein
MAGSFRLGQPATLSRFEDSVGQRSLFQRVEGGDFIPSRQFDHETGLSATTDTGLLRAEWDMDSDDMDIFADDGPNGEPGSIVASNSLRLPCA